MVQSSPFGYTTQSLFLLSPVLQIILKWNQEPPQKGQKMKLLRFFSFVFTLLHCLHKTILLKTTIEEVIQGIDALLSGVDAESEYTKIH